MICRLDRTLNGKLKGRFYTFDDGRKLYLEIISGEKTKSLDRETNSWILPKQTIREAEARDCTQIGVLHKIGKKKFVYITNMKDFLYEPSEPHYISGKEPMRRLNRNLFLVSTPLQFDYINKTLKFSQR